MTKVPLSSNKRIAKNTMFMYFRMLVIMLVALFTSRVVLKTLGVEDYGIYNIVGGVIVLFSFVNNAMSNATQRFLNFAIGTNDKNEVNKVFSMSMTAHISIGVLFLLSGETLGLWFFNTQLNIPFERIGAAQWVYQFTIFSFFINIIKIPYNASIIAYEKMSFYSYSSILEVILRLIIVYLLTIIPFDKLIIYGALTFVVSIIMLVIYIYYTNKVFDTCKYKFFWDANLYKKLMSFSGWSLFGAAANIGSNQGVNVLLNIFYGVTVNAAMGVANQVNGAIYGFVSNFQVAFKPSIIKSYAAEEYDTFKELIYATSRLSYFLLFIISLPVLITTEQLLNIWLVNTPQYAVELTRIIIIASLFDALAAPLWTANEATGKIRNYQIFISLIIFTTLPLSYLALKLDVALTFVVGLKVLMNLSTLIFRILYLQKTIELNSRKFFIDVLLLCVFVSILSLPLPYFTYNVVDGWIGLIATFAVSLISSIITVYIVGLSKNEKKLVFSTVNKYIKRMK